MLRIMRGSALTLTVPTLLIILLGGCASLDRHMAAYDAEYRLKPGDTLVLDTELTFPKDHARVKMQGDGPVGSVDEYHPYCEMEITQVSDGSFKLLPDRFEVWKFSERITPWNIASVPMQVASEDSGSLSQLTYISDIWLRSDSQPEALKMSCRHVVDPWTARFVTLAEVREAVNGVFHIERQP